MAKLVVRPIPKGLKTDQLAFNIDNDSFPYLVNAYEWRGRIKRKRGTSFLGRLTRFFNSADSSYIIGDISGTPSPILGTAPATLTLAANAGNLISGTFSSNDMTPVTVSISTLSPNASLVPGSISITDQFTMTTYTDDSMGNLVGGGGGTVNYASGEIFIVRGGADTITASFLYYPDLPVMGLEDWISAAEPFPGTLAFDTVYSYNILTLSPYGIYDVSFYKNPASGYTDYTQKTVVTPTSWNGENYQQFWSVNYQGAFWATNGINIPFTTENIGMQFAPASSIAYVSNTATTLVVTITGSPLVVGDFVFLNEWTGTNANTLNWQSGYVSNITGANITIKLPNATVGAGPYTPGIIQYLTTRSDTTKDCIRWYDGDPTNGSPTAPVLDGNLGWVNFMPPLSRSNFSIDDNPAAVYYLVGARMIISFKDRLLFLGPVIQSSTGTPIYCQDTVVYSQNGTPYYTASFTGDVSSPLIQFNPILVPAGQTATANSYFEDQTGFGGNISAGYDQPITTAVSNEDAIIIGFSNKQTRLIYTGDDFIPFNFFSINSELGSSSTFSSITLDRGAVTIGQNGIILTSQVSAQRIDLQIPDQVFQFNLENNGIQRICAQRDFINEWIYFTYLINVDDQLDYLFPNQTLQYNYREDSWAVFDECYTTYGQFRILQDDSWATIGNRFSTWEQWNEPWSAGESTLLQPTVIAGNQDGFVVFRDRGTSESISLYVQNIVGDTVTSPDHCLNEGDYIVISGAIGVDDVNGNIFSVGSPTENTFTLIGSSTPSGTYIGGGVIQRMYVPYIQTKQFPVAWDMARKTRLGNQQYLLSTTDNAQITLFIFLSMDNQDPFNLVPPAPEDILNNPLIYNTVLYTCPESVNLGLTPANTNLQMIADPVSGASPQQQIWHRINTSLVGDTIQIGFTLSDAQMRDPTFSNQFAEIELHGFILDIQPSQLLA